MKKIIIMSLSLILFSCEGSNPLSSNQSNDLNPSINESFPESMILSKANNQVITAGGNFRGTFGDGGQTTATIQVKTTFYYSTITFVVSSRGDDGSMYHIAFRYNTDDRYWLTKDGTGGIYEVPDLSKATAQAILAYRLLIPEVTKSLRDKGGLWILPGPPFYAPMNIAPKLESIHVH